MDMLLVDSSILNNKMKEEGVEGGHGQVNFIASGTVWKQYLSIGTDHFSVYENKKDGGRCLEKGKVQFFFGKTDQKGPVART